MTRSSFPHLPSTLKIFSFKRPPLLKVNRDNPFTYECYFCYNSLDSLERGLVLCMADFTFTAPDFGKNPAVFLKEVKAELGKVSWPSRETIIRLTGVVVGVSVLVGVYLGGLDYLFTKTMEIFLKK